MAQGTTRGVPIDTDPTLANDSDLLVPSQKAIKTYADTKVPKIRTLTINGIAYDLSNNVTWSVGTVTSVAALTLGTSGTDLSSTVATGTTTPVITLNVPTASATNRGVLSSTDWTTFNNKQAALGYTPVPNTRTLTINGTTYDLSANRSWTVSGGITVGTTTITSGTSGRIAFNNGGVYGESSNFFWDNTNSRLGIGTSSPSYFLDIISPGNQSSQARFRNTTTQTSVEIYSGSGAVIVGGYSNLSTVTMSEMYFTPNTVYFTKSTGARIMTLSDGYVAIGTNSSPTARLHLPAQTTAAGTGPLKLTDSSGTLLTTPENGLFEFSNNVLYFTVSGTRKIVTLV